MGVIAFLILAVLGGVGFFYGMRALLAALDAHRSERDARISRDKMARFSMTAFRGTTEVSQSQWLK